MDYMPGLQIIRKIREFHEYQDSCFQKLIFMDLRQNSTGFSSIMRQFSTYHCSVYWWKDFYSFFNKVVKYWSNSFIPKCIFTIDSLFNSFFLVNFIFQQEIKKKTFSWWNFKSFFYFLCPLHSGSKIFWIIILGHIRWKRTGYSKRWG